MILDGFDRKKEISNPANGAISDVPDAVAAAATGLSRHQIGGLHLS